MAPSPRITATAAAMLALLLAACSGEISDDDDDTAATDGGGGGDDDDDDDDDFGAGEPAALAGITAAHNEVRAAHGVGPMTWNASLAATAQAWADACTDNEAPAGLIDHNPDRSEGHPYYVGENVYGSSGGATGPGAVELWASEEADYDYDSNTCSGICGHYTQVVWEASVDLGCGISTCDGLTYSTSIVCNYGPGGNYNGERPY